MSHNRGGGVMYSASMIETKNLVQVATTENTLQKT